MGTLLPTSAIVHETSKNDSSNGSQQLHNEKDVDAGALFVLKSKGSWVHCGYHLTTSIVAPPLLSLPYAFTFLGWTAGILCLVIGALVTFYSYNLISLVLEHHAQFGNRQIRFRDMARDILGPRWGRYFVGPIQFAVCYGAVVACILLGGQCMKAIYLLSSPNGTMKLYEFVIIFGCFMLILAQIPSFHSLRHINLVSLVLCLAYSACATGGSIYMGDSSKGPEKDYSVKGDTEDRLFGIFNAVAIIATTYGNGIIPEIQATLAPPVKGKMFKGLSVCYAVLTLTFFSVAISGYWAFGNQSEGLILSNFVDNGKALVPKWFIYMTNIFTIAQLSAVGVVVYVSSAVWDAGGVSEEQSFEVQNFFIGRSLTWYRLWSHRNPDANWETFDMAFLHQFQSDMRPILPEFCSKEVEDWEIEWEEFKARLNLSQQQQPQIKKICKSEPCTEQEFASSSPEIQEKIKKRKKN